MKEVEILVKVLETKQSALSKLSVFEKKKTSKIIDKYYYNSNNKNMFPKKNFGITEFFRIRKQDNDFSLTYKKDKFSGRKWLYSEEHETKIENGKVAEEIVNLLGLKPLVTIENTRTFFYYKDFEIVIEEVKNLGLFMEIEYKKQKGNLQEIKNEIRTLLKSTNIRVSGELWEGKPEMMINKQKVKIK